ncbi:hypothetical protein YTPLAS18_10320 [Nitrospira sp.]|nr:hypothetical protein YTPLAS18_10320 [Nitrospira sp.]
MTDALLLRHSAVSVEEALALNGRQCAACLFALISTANPDDRVLPPRDHPVYVPTQS